MRNSSCKEHFAEVSRLAFKRKGFKLVNVMKNDSKTDYLGNMEISSHPDTIAIINSRSVLNAPMMLIAITGNSLVLAAILTTPSLCSPSIVFLCSLAVSDLLVRLVAQPVYITLVLKFHIVSLIDAYQIVSGLVCGVSLFTMATISMDRFLALRYHMRYPDLLTTKRATYISAATWFICIPLSTIYFLSKTMFFLVITVGIAICLLISTFAYVRIYRIVRHHQLQIQAQQQALESLNTEHNLNMMRSRKSAMNTFIYFICIILCYSPMFVSLLVFVLFKESWITVYTLTNTLVLLNSSINPFLYCWGLSELRAAVIKKLRKMLCKQTEEI